MSYIGYEDVKQLIFRYHQSEHAANVIIKALKIKQVENVL